MKSQVVSKFTEIWLPSSVLILFVIIFAVMLVYVFRKNAKEKFNVAENLPFDEGKKYE